MVTGPDKSNAGANRDRRFWPLISDNSNLRRILGVLGYEPGPTTSDGGQDRMSVILDGDGIEDVAEIKLVAATDSLELTADSMGIPVAVSMTTAEVSTSFQSDTTTPTSPWTLTLYKKVGNGSTYNQVATFSIHTSVF